MIASRTGSLIALAVGLTFGAAACTSAGGNTPSAVLSQIDARQSSATAATAAPSTTAAASASCSPQAQVSYPALSAVPSPDTLPAGSLERTIRQRGYLVVGVAGDTRLLGFRRSLADSAPQGFDVDIATAIGKAILGSNGDIRFKVITAADRFPEVNEGVNAGGVDLVVRAVSMTCARWATTDVTKGAIFSSPYLRVDQRVLTRGSNGTSFAAMTAKAVAAESTVKVCAPAGSTDLAAITGKSGVTPVQVALSSDCFALWQEGRVDAITDDDVILAGFKDQDSSASILPDSLDTTFYGIAVARTHPEFVQYLNAVMATSAFRTSWTDSYAQWLARALGSANAKTLPVADDSRPLPAG